MFIPCPRLQCRCHAQPGCKHVLYCRVLQRPFCTLLVILNVHVLYVNDISNHYSGIIYLCSLALSPCLATRIMTTDVASRFFQLSLLAVPASRLISGSSTRISAPAIPLAPSRRVMLCAIRYSVYFANTTQPPMVLNLWIAAISSVFSRVTHPTLVLLLDFKADGDELWTRVMDHLQPLREHGFSGFRNGSAMDSRPVTVVAMGDVPLRRVLDDNPHGDIFYDALGTLALSSPEFFDSFPGQCLLSRTASRHRWTFGRLSMSSRSSQLARVRDQIRAAHDRGLKVRYWGTPTWPVGLRDYVWRVLVREGADMLNVDDLAGAKQDWRYRMWW
ncbi:hypothetical protein N7492_010052 [Penicillium capsulatum]|uniref:Altered inheritance of mitochondria protein 6 n=1 Tax=Penicillium capsulatum TaxID=69766 RepID=A0A9W9HLQ0_9EURO|nr:hypothetical protein N7492_010052 [Penicillium capsulatum]KAJ6112561.1 hypothetical protein N7512_007885 [Penicillium capsulatum]